MKKGWQIVLIVLLFCLSIVLCSATARSVSPESIPTYQVVEKETEKPSMTPWGDSTPSEKPSEPEISTETEIETVTEPEKKPEPEAEQGEETKAEPESTPAVETSPEPEGDIDPEAKAEQESRREPDQETESETETETETESETESDTSDPKETESNTESESGTESEVESESEEKDPKKDDQKAIYEYDDNGEIIAKTVDGVYYIWDDDYGYREGIRVSEDRIVDADAVTMKKAGIQMTSVLQLPDLPTGCEIVATYMVLKYLHFPISLMKFTNGYFKNEENSADFRHYFVGDPYTPYGLGCYSAGIVSSVNQYLDICESDYLAYNYTGYTFEALLNQVAEGYPVIFWGTQYMREPFLSTYFQVGDETIRWIAQEHCMVLTGYDLEKNLAMVYDPLAGIVQYDLNKLKERFLQLGSQAVIIKKADIGYDKKNMPHAFLYDPNLPKQ